MKMSKSVGQNTLIRFKEKQDPAIVKVKAKASPILDKSFHESSTTCMMHLSLSKSVITGIKDPISHGDDTTRANLLMDQKDKQSKLLKEAKPVTKVSNQGKCLTPPLDTGLNVYILGTWIPDESHILTEVPRAEPVHELNQNPHHKWKPKTEQSVVQVPKPEEGLNDEANFYGFYTQEGVQYNLNWAKIFTEKEVINFRSQRFLSPSICEYATLEEDSSPNKKHPEPNPIIEVKRSLPDFQKAQDHKIWSRKSEDVINLPKPAKPVLHLPYLGDPGFTSNQTQEWQPGDLLSHS
ncbi:hypothetical protein F2Q70_00017065 [Brassica cretica]|uniref:Uncharacterized protein n=1 Tax=Brassica cretica TaxID=69181 RepID=A0A8S9HUM7_BRACR|nr:hypothetical protein F2Q70_00017065 [Brassica cretica]